MKRMELIDNTTHFGNSRTTRTIPTHIRRNIAEENEICSKVMLRLIIFIQVTLIIFLCTLFYFYCRSVSDFAMKKTNVFPLIEKQNKTCRTMLKLLEMAESADNPRFS